MSVESPQSDTELLHAVRAGNAPAYGRLYERHVAAARALARQLVHGEDEVEDVVAESFTKILDLVGRGGGPDTAFRTYLLTVVRRTVHDRSRVQIHQVTSGEVELFDPGMPFTDPALTGLEGSLIAKAYLSLPERWRAVLWHTEVERARPADVAPLLGLSANGVAALAYRAREGLRQAYLQAHLASSPPPECGLVLSRLGAYVRGGLTRRDTKAVDEHVSDCSGCHAVLRELTEVNRSLRAVVGPLVLGTAAAGYATAMTEPGFAHGWLMTSGLPRALGLMRRLPGRQWLVVAGGAATVLAVAASFALVPADPPAPVTRSAGSVRPSPLQAPPLTPSHVLPTPLPERVPAREPAAPPAHDRPKPAGAGLRATIAVMGSLVRAQRGIVAMRLHNDGDAPSEEVYTAIELPPGVTLVTPRPDTVTPITRPAPADGLQEAAAPPEPHSDTDTAAAPRAEARTGKLVPALSGRAGEDVPALSGRAGEDVPVVSGRARVGTPVVSGGRVGRAARVALGGRAGKGAAVAAGGGGAPVRPVGIADGWSCRPAGSGARCARRPLAPGRRTAVFLRVQVAAEAPVGKRPTLRVEAGSVKLTARAATGVRPSGVPARFAADGKVTVRAVGNAFLTCPAEREDCREARLRRGDQRDNDLWPMRLLDEDRAATTHASSGAVLALPKGGRVVWAGLYWSATATEAGPIKLRPPGRKRYVTIHPSQVAHRDLPAGPAYQAYADVTGLVGGVRRQGTWWAADAPMGALPPDYESDPSSDSSDEAAAPMGNPHSDPGTRAPAEAQALGPGAVAQADPQALGHGAVALVGGRPGQAVAAAVDGRSGEAVAAPVGVAVRAGLGGHAGWSLVVVATDPRRPYSQAVVLDGAAVIGGGTGPVRMPLGGLEPAGSPARAELVTWEGDADLAGDKVSLGSGPLEPAGGDRDPANVFDGSSNGVAEMTFGVDVDTVSAPLRARPGLAIVAEKDVVLFGVAAVSVRAQP